MARVRDGASCGVGDGYILRHPAQLADGRCGGVIYAEDEMAVVNLVINGHNYNVDCNDGEEAQLQKLGAAVDAKVLEVVRMVGQVGELRLLLMASMLLADDAGVAQEKAQEAERSLAGLKRINADLQSQLSAAETKAAEKLDIATGRVEAVIRLLDAPAPAEEELQSVSPPSPDIAPPENTQGV